MMMRTVGHTDGLWQPERQRDRKYGIAVTAVLSDANGNWGTTGGSRETTCDNDCRGRPILITRPGTPRVTLNEYDNLGRLIGTHACGGTGAPAHR